MNNKNTDPIGIDEVIEKVKNDIYDNLVDLWGGEIDAYGRVYKNINSSNQFKPEAFYGEGEYKEVFLNDEVSCTFFFLEGDKDTTEDEILFVSDVKVIFMVNLKEIYPNNKGREDERARAVAVDVLRDFTFHGYTIKGIQKGLKNVFLGLDISQMKYQDIQPYHCFSIEIDLEYYLTKICT